MTSRKSNVLVQQGESIERFVLAEEHPFWLGRDPSCDYRVAGRGVSKRHVGIKLVPKGVLIMDASTNGTLVNGKWLNRSTRLCESLPVTVQVADCRVELWEDSKEAPKKEAPKPDQAGSPPERQYGVAERRDIHRQLLKNLDLQNLDRQALSDPTMRPRVEVALRRILSRTPATKVPERLVDREEELIQELADEALGLGPLERLLSDEQVSEIMVVDPHNIFVERCGKMELSGLRFTDDDRVRAVIERIVTPLGRRIDESSPLVDARLKDGSRVNAVIPPLALKGPCITIRKFSKEPLRMSDLVGFGSVSKTMARFLENSVRAKRNIVISGGTGSGKTTLLNVLSAAIPEGERIVTVEDAAELQLAQPHVVSLESRPPNLEGKGAYSIRDLVQNALRMRPDRIVVGECRGGEALDMLQAMNTGHEGSLTTTHANSPREAVARLETLCLMAGLDLPVRAIRQQIASSIHLIIQQTRFSDGSRRVRSVAELLGIDDQGEVELQEIYRFREEGAEFVATGVLPTFVDRLLQLGLVEQGQVL